MKKLAERGAVNGVRRLGGSSASTALKGGAAAGMLKSTSPQQQAFMSRSKAGLERPGWLGRTHAGQVLGAARLEAHVLHCVGVPLQPQLRLQCGAALAAAAPAAAGLAGCRQRGHIVPHIPKHHLCGKVVPGSNRRRSAAWSQPLLRHTAPPLPSCRIPALSMRPHLLPPALAPRCHSGLPARAPLRQLLPPLCLSKLRAYPPGCPCRHWQPWVAAQRLCPTQTQRRRYAPPGSSRGSTSA